LIGLGYCQQKSERRKPIMSFQKHQLVRLAVDKLGATFEEALIAKSTDSANPQLAAAEWAPAPIPLSQRIGAALRLRLKTILPFSLWADQSG
jgi:hypothetical protein